MKIDAMYRNELLDDIINLGKLVQNTVDCLEKIK